MRDAGISNPLGLVPGPLTTTDSLTWWGFWREGDLDIGRGLRPPPDLGQVFWWDSVTRDAGFAPRAPAPTDVLAVASGAVAVTVLDGGAFISAVNSDGGVSDVRSWPGEFADCRFRGGADRLWCTTTDLRALLALDADGGARNIHDGGSDRLFLLRVVGADEPVLFFANAAPNRAWVPDAGYQVLATRARWPTAVLMYEAPTVREVAVGSLNDGGVRFGTWLANDGGLLNSTFPLSWADYCFPSDAP